MDTCGSSFAAHPSPAACLLGQLLVLLVQGSSVSLLADVSLPVAYKLWLLKCWICS